MCMEATCISACGGGGGGGGGGWGGEGSLSRGQADCL
jgi:hypothetical protein